MSINFKNAVEARENFMTEKEDDANEKIDDPWVVKDIQLELTDNEKEIFELLEQTRDANTIDKKIIVRGEQEIEKQPLKDHVRIRAVGGWLRDKILLQKNWVKTKQPLKIKDRLEIVIETDHQSDKQLKAYEFALMFATQTLLEDPEFKFERGSKEIDGKAN